MKKIVLYFLLLLLLCFIFSCEEESSTEPDGNDTIAPSIFIQNPTSDNVFVTIATTLDISGTAADDEALDKITWNLNSRDSGTASGKENWLIDDMDLSLGENVITVTAHDKANHTSWDQITITRNNYVSFYGSPTTNPTGIIANSPTPVTITASLAPSPTMPLTSVVLQLNNAGIWEDVTALLDNGSLGNGDEILGDNVYSTIYSFNMSEVGNMELRVTALTMDGTDLVPDHSSMFHIGVYEELTNSDFAEINTMQTEVGDMFESNLDGSDIETAIASTHNWVSQQPGVVSSQIIENGIDIVYDSGIVGGIRIYQEDASGEITTKGWSNTARKRDRIPNWKQTVGTKNFASIREEDEEDIIGNNSILIWAPFEDAFGIDMRPSLETIIDNSELEFNVVSLTNNQCTVSSLSNLTEYGIVIFDTHGSEGMELGTGEEVTLDSYIANAINLLTNRVSIWQNVTVGYSGEVAVKKNIFAVRAPYIDALSGSFPNSLIFNGSCESSKTMSLKNAFINKGAQTYFGFDKVVNTQFCKSVCDDIIQDVVVDLETTGDGFTSGQNDPVSPNATYEMYGNDALHFSLSLINGDFEMGNLTGWNIYGDGRVITQLGTALPTEGSFMGIISTGLGYTVDTGSIYQSFKVLENETELSLKWNFFSEEFMEFVGSQYQDFFKVSIIDETGNETTLFYKTIDDMADQYTLSLVSPGIGFDVGDVYGTGWLELEFDLSAYQNQIVTIVFAAGDVGDSIYDTVILLDEISIY